MRNNKSIIMMLFALFHCSIILNGCFSGPNVQQIEDRIFQCQNSDILISDCFKGYRFGMSPEEVEQHTYEISNGERGQGKFKNFYKVNLYENYYIYLPIDNYVLFYKDEAYSYQFWIDINDLDFFVNFYRTHKYKFESMNGGDWETQYNMYFKDNLVVLILRDSNDTMAQISYTNQPIVKRINHNIEL